MTQDLPCETPSAADAREPYVETLVTYLEMTAPPATPLRSAPRAGLEVRLARRSTVSFYRYLYGTIGADWTWVVRRLLADGELRADPGRSRGRGERALGRRRPGRATPSSTTASRPTSSSPTSACCRSSSARAWAAGCSIGPSATPGGRGRAGSGSTPAISTTRGRSAFTESPGFELYDQRIERLQLPDGMRPPERPRSWIESQCESS